MFRYCRNSLQRLGKAWVWDLLWGLGQFWAPEANREAAVAPALGAEVASLGQLKRICKEVKDSGDRYLLTSRCGNTMQQATLSAEITCESYDGAYLS